MVAIAMLVLMGMAAVAIDLSAGWNERRQDQTASDLAAVAGALSFENTDLIADQAMAVAREDVNAQFTDAEWDALWTACADPDRPAGFVPVNHSSLGLLNCISVNPSYVRVRLPDQLTDTSFAKLLGVDILTTHADTIVTLFGEDGSGALPFAIRGDTGSGEICLDTSTGSKIVPPCDGNESGSFGNIAPPLFGSEKLQTSPDCSNQASANNHVAEGIAMGMDHFIYKFSTNAWNNTKWDRNDNTSKSSVDAVANMDECTDTGGPLAEPADGVPINAVYVDTGNSTKGDITEGLVTGTSFQDGGDALLTRSGDVRDVDGYDLDNVPLWEHLRDFADPYSIPECDKSTYAGLDIATKNDRMRTCLETYQSNGSTERIFEDSVGDGPRAGIAPRLWHYNLGSGLSFRPIETFNIVYINAIWFDDKDETAFYPDDEDNSSINMKNWKEVEQVTAFLLLDSMVSDTVIEEFGGLPTDTFTPRIYE